MRRVEDTPAIVARRTEPPRTAPRAPEPPSGRRWLSVTVAFAVAAAGLTFAIRAFRSGDHPAPASTVTKGRIAFSALDGQTWQIYSVEPDGSGLTQLTHVPDPEVTGDPSWSPDGTRIVFTVQPSAGNRSDIWVMDADGSNLRQLTDGNGWNWAPAWSPDGNRIAFARGDPSNIYAVNADGSHLARLTQLTAGDESASDPSWSPDGSQIVFSPGGEVEKDLYVVNADGTGERRLLDLPGYQMEPAWSPDGSTIGFTSGGPQDAPVGIYAIDANGTNLHRLNDQPAVQSPAWSPDGSRIAFMAIRPGTDDDALYTMNPDGSDVREIPGLPKGASFPSWQPVLPGGQSPTPAAAPGKLAIAARVQVPGAVSLAAGYGSVWVSGFGELTRVDQASGQIEATIPVKGVEDFSRVEIGEGSVWVSADGGIVYRVDPGTNQVVETIDTGDVIGPIAVGDAYLWVASPGAGASDPGTLIRIDPRTGLEVETPISVGPIRTSSCPPRARSGCPEAPASSVSTRRRER